MPTTPTTQNAYKEKQQLWKAAKTEDSSDVETREVISEALTDDEELTKKIKD
jgi:hypothetical protein